MAFKKGNKLKRFTGLKHTEESNNKRRETIRRLYAEGKNMGFRSPAGKLLTKISRPCKWKGQKLPFSVWNKGMTSYEYASHYPNGFGMTGKKVPSGKDSPSWKGGLTPLRIQIQNTLEWKDWIKSVMERDKYSCVDCGISNNKLHVDHITPYCVLRFRYNINSVKEAIDCKALWDVANGRVLCKECHKKTPTYLSGAQKLMKEERVKKNEVRKEQGSKEV